MGDVNIAEAGFITVGADAEIAFGWDEPDPADDTGVTRRALNISGDVVTAAFRLRLGDTPILSKTSSGGGIVIDSSPGVVLSDGTIRHGRVVIADTDLIGLLGETSDLYCTLTLVRNEGPVGKSVARVRARVVE